MRKYITEWGLKPGGYDRGTYAGTLGNDRKTGAGILERGRPGRGAQRFEEVYFRSGTRSLQRNNPMRRGDLASSSLARSSIIASGARPRERPSPGSVTSISSLP